MNPLEFFTHSQISSVQMIGIIELIIGFFGLFIAHMFRRNKLFRFKLAMVYCLPIVIGLLTVGDSQDTRFIKHFLILAFMIYITILYWREVKSLTTTEGYHRNALSDYLDDIPDLIWVKDADCRYTYVNKAMQKVFKVHRSEILGKTDIEIGICKRRKKERFDFDIVCDSSDRLVKISQESKMFLESGFIDNNFYSFQVYKAPILIHSHNEEMRQIGYIGIARDLTYDILDHKEIDKLIKEGNLDSAIQLFELHIQHYNSVKLTEEDLDIIKVLPNIERKNVDKGGWR